MIEHNPIGFLSITLNDCFDYYHDLIFLNGTNQKWCNICESLSDFIIKKKMIKSPEVITIFLNRREFDVEFEYPLVINIDKYNTSKNNDYELICVLTYIILSGKVGCFIAICKSPINGHWYCYKDEIVSEIDDPRKIETQDEVIPYVLFYEKSNKQ